MNISSMIALGMMGVHAINALKSYSYTASWLSAFTLPEQNAQGWSVFTPSVDSRIMYVSDTYGDDVAAAALNSGNGYYASSDFDDVFLPSSLPVAYKNIETAIALMRAGFPDYVLIDRGDTFTPASQLTIPAGRSATERAVLGYYGTGARPFIDRVGDSVAVSSYVAVLGLEITDTTRIPEHANFVGFASIDDGRGIYLNSLVTQVADTFIEGCYIHHKGIGVSYVGVDFVNNAQRRNIIADTFKNGLGRHPQGIWAENGNFIIDDMVMVNNGFYHDHASYPVYPWLEPTVFSHNGYFAHTSNTIVKNIVSLNPSSLAWKFTANIENMILQQNLTTAGVTSITVNAINANLPQAGSFEIKLDNIVAPFSKTVEYTSWLGATFQIVSTDFDVDNASIGNVVVGNYIAAENIAVSNFYAIDGEVGISLGGNEKDATAIDNYANSDSLPRWRNCYAQGVILDDIGYSQNTGRTLSYGNDFDDQANSTMSEIIKLPTTNPAITTDYAIAVGGYSSGLSFLNSMSYLAGGFPSNSSFNGAIDSCADLSSAAIFADPTRNALTYQRSVDGGTTYADVRASLLAKDYDNWNDSHTFAQMSQHIRDGFYVLDNIVEYSAPTLLPMIVGDAASNVFFGAFGNTRLTYQWKLDGVDISGATSATYSYTPLLADNGKTLTCVATDEYGKTLTSTGHVLAVAATGYHVTLNGTNAYIDVTNLSANANTPFSYAMHINTSGGFILLGQPTGWSDYIYTAPSINAIRIAINGVNLETPQGVIAHDGLDHLVTVYRDALNNIYIDLDGMAYLVGNNSSDFQPSLIGRAVTSYYQGTVWGLHAETYLGIYDFAMKHVKNDGETEASTSGTATMTYHNTTGLWSAA